MLTNIQERDTSPGKNGQITTLAIGTDVRSEMENISSLLLGKIELRMFIIFPFILDNLLMLLYYSCRKPKIPENALECHEYIEDENVGKSMCNKKFVIFYERAESLNNKILSPEFPTCCARLRCVVELNGERIVQTRGQPGELFPDKYVSSFVKTEILSKLTYYSSKV